YRKHLVAQFLIEARCLEVVGVEDHVLTSTGSRCLLCCLEEVGPYPLSPQALLDPEGTDITTAQPHLGGSGLPRLGTQSSPEPNERSLHSSTPYLVLPVLEFWRRRWVFLLGQVALASQYCPFPRPQPTPYACQRGQRAGDLWFVVAPYSGLPGHRGYPTPCVLLGEDHLHGLGDSRGTRGARHRAVGRYARHSVESPPYRWLGRRGPLPDTLRGLTVPRVW